MDMHTLIVSMVRKGALYMHSKCPSCQNKLKFSMRQRFYQNNFKVICHDCGASLVVKKWSSYLYLLSLLLPVLLLNLFFREVSASISIILVVAFALFISWFISPLIIRYRIKKPNEII